MGIFDYLKQNQQKAPAIISIFPDAAKQEISNGRLPVINTNKLFLKKGETCHYIDKAVYEKKNVNKRYVRNGNGYSIPGIFRGTRIHIGGGHTDVLENVQYDNHRGILYITNKRIIFVGNDIGFDKKIDELVAVTPYLNCIEMQFSKEIIKLFVPDGNITFMVLQQIK